MVPVWENSDMTCICINVCIKSHLICGNTNNNKTLWHCNCEYVLTCACTLFWSWLMFHHSTLIKISWRRKQQWGNKQNRMCWTQNDDCKGWILKLPPITTTELRERHYRPPVEDDSATSGWSHSWGWTSCYKYATSCSLRPPSQTSGAFCIPLLPLSHCKL